MVKLLKAKQQKKRGINKNHNVSRARATTVLAQGVGVVPRRAFGGITKKTSIPRSLTPLCWNAHSSVHAGLPRAVGPYTVVRTTTLITTKSPFMMFGTFAIPALQDQGSDPTKLNLGFYGPKQWTNICAVGAKEDITSTEMSSSSIGDSTVSQIYQIPVPGVKANGIFADNVKEGETPTFYTTASNTTAVPSALSVQVINPNAMQTASGTAAAAVCPVRLDLMNEIKSWGQVGDELVSYYRPRILSGGKLALRGVQMDSLPLSMSEVSEFRELWEVDNHISYPSNLCWNGADKLQDISDAPALSTTQKTFRTGFTPEGWAPIVYYSPSASALPLAERQAMVFLVTMEWRVRFDISNPASSSHKMHKPSTDSEWHSMIQRASDALPGVIDIVDKVADAGMKLSAKYAAMGG